VRVTENILRRRRKDGPATSCVIVNWTVHSYSCVIMKWTVHSDSCVIMNWTVHSYSCVIMNWTVHSYSCVIMNWFDVIPLCFRIDTDKTFKSSINKQYLFIYDMIYLTAIG
jgi:hypothetical protein